MLPTLLGTDWKDDMVQKSVRGQVAIVGVGESQYFKRGQSPASELELTLTAILNAARDANLDAHDIDGFVSFADDSSVSNIVANALGVREMRWSGMQWGGGGAGSSGAVQQAVAAIAAGFAETVVVYRGLAQTALQRKGAAHRPRSMGDSLRAAYGFNSPAELYASRMTRFMHEHGVSASTQEAVSRASYFHAQHNPRAVMNGRELNSDTYGSSRWIVEPWRLFDCCQENDGAAALILTSAERASEFTDQPVYVLGAAQGGDHRSGGLYLNVLDSPDWATADFKTIAPRLYEMAEVTPSDIDVVQSYENFTGGVVMSLIEHGFCTPEEANEVLTFENLTAPGGKLPLNTSGGNLAEAYIHGHGLTIEGVRQLRGESANQVEGARLCLVSGGPMVTPASSLILGSKEAL